MGQSRISTHLAQLKRAGLVIDRRAGKHIYYGLAPSDDPGDPSRARLREIVAASAKEIPESATDRVALGAGPAQTRGPRPGVFQPAGG